jgi:hypothetical protein
VDLDLRKVRYFVVLAEELNYRRAAERLHVAQPVLTRQIRSLERDLTDRRGNAYDAVAHELAGITSLPAPVQSPPTRGHEPALSPRPMGAKESGLAISQSARQEGGAWLSSSPGSSHS